MSGVSFFLGGGGGEQPVLPLIFKLATGACLFKTSLQNCFHMNHISFGSSVDVLIWSKFLDFKSLMNASASSLLNF